MRPVMESLWYGSIHKMNAIAEMEAFRYGVRFGIRLMMETDGSLACPTA